MHEFCESITQYLLCESAVLSTAFPSCFWFLDYRLY